MSVTWACTTNGAQDPGCGECVACRQTGVAPGPRHKYVDFTPLTQPAHLKTSAWMVRNIRHGTCLGHVRWHSAWRQYVFFPEAHCLFSADCLNFIAGFIEQQMAERP